MTWVSLGYKCQAGANETKHLHETTVRVCLFVCVRALFYVIMFGVGVSALIVCVCVCSCVSAIEMDGDDFCPCLR